MQGGQVSFGRRGRQQEAAKPRFPIAAPNRTQTAPAGQTEPDTVITRSLSKAVLVTIVLSVVILLIAGSSKHGHDLPYWMRTGADFHLSNFSYPLAFCVLTAVLLIAPVLLRPVALRFYTGHFDYSPILGGTRTIRWSEIDEITSVDWGKYKRLVIKTQDGRKLRIYGNALSISRAELKELLLTRRATCGADLIARESGTMNPSYLFPGH